MNIILYTTGCPLCRRLESMLDDAKIIYTTVTDISIMADKGFMSAPMLEVEGKAMTYAEAKLWIGERIKNVT